MHLIVKILLICICIAMQGMAQIGGSRSYDFLNLPVNATMSGLGGVGISTMGLNNQWLVNPATMDSAAWGGASINFLDYFAGINYSNVSYVAEHAKLGGIGFGFQYLNHGMMDAFDPTGASLGSFDANEFAFTVGHGRAFGPFRMGVNLKLAASAIESFRSTALLMDVGGIFYPTENKLVSVGLGIRNIGFILSDYSETSDSSVPFDVQLGATFKPQYMPLRFTVTAYNLTRADVIFFDQRITDPADEPGFSEQIFRRLNFGTEILLSENFQFQVGYNHMVRKELNLNNSPGSAGFSYGFLVKIKRIQLNYARAFYHVAAASNYFSVNTNINYYIKKN